MTHHDLILDQFTQQAIPFSDAPSMRDEAAIKLLIDAAQTKYSDRSLDVACGPGMVALAFARVVQQAIGLDATPAMLTRAKELQRNQSLHNIEWHEGDATSLPFPDNTFDIVTCRFAFHHLENPSTCLREMLRVAKLGGSIVVCDAIASSDAAKADAFNTMERLRDPSTVRFLTLLELRQLLTSAGQTMRSETPYRVPAELEGLMRTSFPATPENAERVRRMIIDSIATDNLGLGTRYNGDRVVFHYPAVVLSATKC